MSYHHLFDHLGRPLVSARSSKPSIMHRLFQRACAVVMIVCLFILIWGR